MEEKKEQSTFEKDLAMLKFFQEEFLYRHKHYWDVLMKTFLVAVVVTVLPIVSEVLGVKLDDLPRQYLFFFPALGAAISLLSYDLLRRESDRLNRVGGFKNDLLQKLEEAGKLENTLIVASPDHIPYFDVATLEELAGQQFGSSKDMEALNEKAIDFDVYKSSLIIW